MAFTKRSCGELLWHLSDMKDPQWERRNIDRQSVVQTLLSFFTEENKKPDTDMQTNNPAIRLWTEYETLCAKCVSTDAAHKSAFEKALDNVFPIIKRRKVVYICSPYSGNIQQNIHNACEAAKEAILEDEVAPIVPHLMYPSFLDDNNPKERTLGIELDIDIISKCDELWYYGDKISAGMRAEIDFAQEHGIPVISKPWPIGTRLD